LLNSYPYPGLLSLSKHPYPGLLSLSKHPYPGLPPGGKEEEWSPSQVLHIQYDTTAPSPLGEGWVRGSKVTKEGWVRGSKVTKEAWVRGSKVTKEGWVRGFKVTKEVPIDVYRDFAVNGFRFLKIWSVIYK